jgi:hypothetical protein
MLNGQPPMPITSVRYFLGLIEVRQTDTPDGCAGEFRHCGLATSHKGRRSKAL